MRRVLVRNALEPVDQSSGSSEDVPSTKSLMCDATTQCNDPLVEEVRSLKEKNSKLTGDSKLNVSRSGCVWNFFEHNISFSGCNT